MKIGDVVISKKMGLPTKGKIVAIMDAAYYGSAMPNQGFPGLNAYMRFKQEYPNMERVCTVLFDNPVRFSTPQDYMGFFEENQLPVEIVKYQFMTQPGVCVQVYPEDDLELYDEATYLGPCPDNKV